LTGTLSWAGLKINDKYYKNKERVNQYKALKKRYPIETPHWWNIEEIAKKYSFLMD
jgi:hypothetical protein